jgi:hypothetical protein
MRTSGGGELRRLTTTHHPPSLTSNCSWGGSRMEQLQQQCPMAPTPRLRATACRVDRGCSSARTPGAQRCQHLPPTTASPCLQGGSGANGPVTPPQQWAPSTPPPTPTPMAPAPAPPTQDRTMTGMWGRRRGPRYQTPPLQATAHSKENWCVWVMTGRGGPTTRVDNDSTPHHRCEQLLTGWIWGAEEATRWGLTRGTTQREEPPRHGKEGHTRHPACGHLFRFLFFCSYFCRSTKEYIA